MHAWLRFHPTVSGHVIRTAHSSPCALRTAVSISTTSKQRSGVADLRSESMAAPVIYSVIASLDGYVADRDGNFDWAEPDEEVHTFVNDRERPVGTYLYGRRMYEVMVAWETMDLAGQPSFARDYAEIWRATDKVVYSTTLDATASARTQLERSFDPEAIRTMKASAERPISVGGPGLAAEALRAGLVDECSVFLAPVVVGGGTAWLPDDLRLNLELMDERRFVNGTVHLHYRV
jgi:dihydrofolate reductase